MGIASPAIHVYSQENTRTVMKKPGPSSVSRKPFQDKPVNGSSPAVNKNLKPQSSLKKSLFTVSRPLELPEFNDEDLFFYDKYSFRCIEDQYPDIQRLSLKDCQKGLRSYCNYNNSTTPVKLYQNDDSLDAFLEMSEEDLSVNEEWNEKVFEVSIDNVSLPVIEFD